MVPPQSDLRQLQQIHKGLSESYYQYRKTEWARSLTHPFNAVSLWCASSHVYYITQLLLPGLTPLTKSMHTLLHMSYLYLLPRLAAQKYCSVNYSLRTIPEQSRSRFREAGIDPEPNNKRCSLPMHKPLCPHCSQI